VGNEIIIGDRLRQARLNKNISIDELQKRTKIQKRYLNAIEVGDFQLLPGEYYVRAFLRDYAAAVGENGEELVALFEGKEYFEKPLPQRPEPEVAEGSRTRMHEEEAQKKHFLDYLPMMILGLIALTIVIIVGYLTLQERRETKMIGSTASSFVVEQPKTASTSVSTASSSEKETTASSTQTSTSEEPEVKTVVKRIESTQARATFEVSEATNPVVLTFKGQKDSCWVGVMVDGAGDYLFQQTLGATDQEKVTLPKDAQDVAISLGESANVTVELNGEAVDFADPSFDLLQKNLHLTIEYQ
jgi:Uncharacterized protein conserved in bacteria